jgi:hypothetical protein
MSDSNPGQYVNAAGFVADTVVQELYSTHQGLN